MDDTIESIASWAERLSGAGRHDDVAWLARDLAGALDEAARAERPGLFASRELARIGDDARSFLRDAE